MQFGLSFRRFVPMFEIELAAYFANKQMLVSSLLVQPIVYLLLLGGGLETVVDLEGRYEGVDSYLSFILPGLFALQGLGTVTHVIYRATIDRRWGLLAFKKLAGGGALAYLAALSVAPVVAVLCQVIVLTILAVLMGASVNGWNLLLAASLTLALSVFWPALGLTVTAIISNYQQRDMVITLMMLPLVFSAPIFYPVEGASRYIQWISRLNPLTYQVEVVREAFLLGEFSWRLPVMVAATVLAVIVAISTMGRGDLLSVGER